jgi:hypothetical protein
MAVSLPPKIGMDNVLSISGLLNQSELPKSPLVEVNHLHVIFDFNGVLVALFLGGLHPLCGMGVTSRTKLSSTPLLQMAHNAISLL